jgi:enoyl-CoA hydratase/carnithine racemase
MPDGGVRLERDGPVATVTLCRPDVLNAQTPATWSALREISRDLPGDTRVVIVRGEGRAFSAGLDRAVLAGGAADDSPDAADTTFGELVRLPPRACADRIAEFQGALTWLRRPDLVTIAAVQGHAIGAGFQLALACDLRVLADDARLSMAEVTLGLVPDLGGTKRLVELVGYARALELCVTGRRMPATEAYAAGLANVVVPRAELDGAARDLAAAVLAGPRDAVIEIKALLAGAADRSYAEQDTAEREAQTRRLRDLAGLGE